MLQSIIFSKYHLLDRPHPFQPTFSQCFASRKLTTIFYFRIDQNFLIFNKMCRTEIPISRNSLKATIFNDKVLIMRSQMERAHHSRPRFSWISSKFRPKICIFEPEMSNLRSGKAKVRSKVRGDNQSRI